jgi:flagellar hook-associated protein 2
MLSEPVAGASGNYTSLASLGITTTASGTLQLDSAKFKAALEADPLAVNKVFSSENGVAAKLGKYLDGKLSSTGELATRDAGITSRRKDLDRDREALEARMTVIQERYLKQFSALDGMLAQLQSTSSYLTGQLENLSKLANRDN